MRRLGVLPFAMIALFSGVSLFVISRRESLAADGPAKTLTIDLTEDTHHRRAAGLLDLDREPLVCQVSQNSGVREMRSADEFIRIAWDLGVYSVRTDEHGYLVMYMDEAAYLAHITVAVDSPDKHVARVFREYPQHHFK